MADQEHELTFQFKHKIYGSAEKVESGREWIERQIRVSLHDYDKTIQLVIVEDKIKDETRPLPGLENV